jgi:hypothetical protein
MSNVDQARELARLLAPLLQGAACPGSADAEQPRPKAPTHPNDPDVDLAVRLELQHVICKSPDVLPPPDASQDDLERAGERLYEFLTNGDGHARDVLWALLSGEDGQPHPGVLRLAAASPPRGQRGDRGRSVLRPLWNKTAVRFVKSAALRRQVAGLWMNALIGLVMAFAWWFTWPPPAGGPPAGVLGLGLFAIWSLSFLPNWLYIRFLGQRAGALWDEYVLNLHRLGWDSPGHLPRPPVNSEFFVEWFNDGGVLLAHRQNLYRQKFDAYYGKSVAESSHGERATVKIESLFPIFLLTVTLAVCWTAVLWDLSFVRNPSSVWDTLKFGFLGAYSFTLQMLVRRFFQSDLRPSAYANAMLRIITVLLLVAALHQLMPTDNPRTEAAIAFVVGLFPLVGMQALQRTAAAVLRAAVPSLTPPYPLNQVDGLSVWYEARLLEEGIEDMQSLATANFVDVMLHTRVPVGRLVDWVDQAHLYLHFDRIERGWLERTSRRLQKHDGAKAEKMDVTGTEALVRGSVTTTSRAGTRTRTAFRQLGIRTATDLLKAFPAEAVDPNSRSPSRRPSLHLHAIKSVGLDVGQVGTMVRVLAQETSLAPVWNWQKRGVRHRP